MMARINGVSRVTWICTIESVVPLRSHGCARCDWNDDLRNRLLVGVDTAIADDIVGGDIRNWLRG